MCCVCFHHSQHKLPHLHRNLTETKRMPACHLFNKCLAPDNHAIHKPPIPHRKPAIPHAHSKQGQTLLGPGVAFCRRAGCAPFVVGCAGDDSRPYRIAVDVGDEIVQIPAVLNKRFPR